MNEWSDLKKIEWGISDLNNTNLIIVEHTFGDICPVLIADVLRKSHQLTMNR